MYTVVRPQVHSGFEVVIAATGRHPLTSTMGLSKAGVTTKPKSGYIEVDEYQNTNVPGVYALGDVCGLVELTPMAIAAGRKLADRYGIIIYIYILWSHGSPYLCISVSYYIAMNHYSYDYYIGFV